jgi:Tfp pilus assembly protein PilO
MEIPKINLPQIQTKYKIMAALGIIGLLLGFYFDHAYKPHADKIKELEDGILGLDDTIKVIKNLEYPDAKNDDIILKRIDKKKKAIVHEIEQFEKKLPAKADYSKILEKITQLAYKAGFEIKTLEPREVSVTEGYTSMSLEMNITSKFINLLNFLEAIKPYPIYLKGIELNIKERPLLFIRLNLAILAK